MSITKTFKGYSCEISNSPIFWTINTIDKPNKDFLNSITWTQVNFTPNFVDQFTTTIVADSENYTLLKIYEIYESVDGSTSAISYENEKIFINSNISKVLKKGYLLTFDLDLWATYGVNFLDYLNNNDYLIHVKRALSPSIYKKCVNYNNNLKDSTLNLDNYPMATLSASIDKSQLQLKKVEIIDYFDSNGFHVADSYEYIDAQTGIFQLFGDDGNTLNKPLVYIYEWRDGYYYCFLINSNGNNFTTLEINDKNITDKIAALNQFYIFGDGLHLCRDVDVLATFGINNGDISALSNKFVGIFEFNFFEFVANWFVWSGKYNKDGKYIEIDGGHSFLGFRFNRSQFLELTTTPFYQKRNWYLNGVEYNPNGSTVSYNSTTPSGYLYQQISLYGWNFSVGNSSNKDNNPLYFLSGGVMTFDGNNFNFIYSVGASGVGYINNTILNQLPGTFNCSTDSYATYINSVKSSQNTGLQIARQQLKYSTLSNLSGMLQNILTMPAKVGGSLLKGDLGGAVNNLWGGIFGTVNGGINQFKNISKYENVAKQINAQNLDAKNSATASNIGSSVATDDIKNKANLYKKYSSNSINTSFLINFPNNPNDIVKLNNYVYLYGINVEMSLNSRDLFNIDDKNKYLYIDFDANDELLRLWKPDINTELLESLKILVNNSFRIWKSWVDYSAIVYYKNDGD